MSSDRRQRKKQQRRRVDAARAEQRKADRQRRLILGGGSVVAVLTLVVLIVLLVVHQTSSTSSGTTETTIRPVTAADFGSGACPNGDGSSPPKTTFKSAPKECIDPTQHYSAKVATSVGDFTISLDAARAPVTVNNFVVLAEYHYYDRTTFHRVIPAYIAQGGDANGKPPGTGNPGYSIPDEFPSSLSDFKAGSVAMANTGAPHSGAAQFFIWLGPERLPSPSYSLFGQITAGMDTVKRIEDTGSPTGVPTNPVTILSVTVGVAQLTGG